MSWKYFYGASFLVFMLLMKYGAPIPALVGGVALAVIVNWRLQHKAPAKATRKSLPPEK